MTLKIFLQNGTIFNCLFMLRNFVGVNELLSELSVIFS